MSFSNWDKNVLIKRHGKRERYDADIKAFCESAAKSVQVSVKDVTLDSLRVALRERISKLGFSESLNVRTVRDSEKKIKEVWIIRKE